MKLWSDDGWEPEFNGALPRFVLIWPFFEFVWGHQPWSYTSRPSGPAPTSKRERELHWWTGSHDATHKASQSKLAEFCQQYETVNYGSTFGGPQLKLILAARLFSAPL